MLEIFSIQDPTVLWGVFNAIATIFSNSTYMAAATVVSIFTIFALAVNSINPDNKEMPFATWLISAILFTGAYTTMVDVSIENRFTGEVSQVDNIPVGVAAPAAVLTSVGLNLTQLVETAYGNTGDERITTAGFLSPLRTIVELRNATDQECPVNFRSSVAAGINMCGSIKNYVRDCVNVKIARSKNPYEIRQENILDTIKFSSEAYGTQLYDSNFTPVEYSCKDAYELIKGSFNTVAFDTMIDKLAISAKESIGEDATTKTLNALKSLSSQVASDTISERNFLFSAYLAKPMDAGTVEFLIQNGQSGMAENLTTSIQQRNYGWIMQGEMWVKMLNRFLALMESLLYAISPFIGLMVLTGTMGKKTFGLYIQLLIVMQLIPPMTVIVQNIVLDDVRAYSHALLKQGMVMGSTEYYYAFSKYCLDQLGLGGLYASTIVPTIAFSLVTGSAMALSSVFKSAAAVPKDTDMVSNQIDQGSANVDVSGMINNVSKNNVMGTQQEMDAMAKLDMKSSASQAVSAAQTNVNKATETFKNAGSISRAATDGTKFDGKDATSLNEALSSTHNQRFDYIDSKVKEATTSYGLDHGQQAMLRAALYAQGEGHGSVGFEALGNGGGFRFAVGGKFEFAGDETVKAAFNNARGQKDSETQQYSFNEEYSAKEQADYKTEKSLTTSSDLVNKQSHEKSLAYQKVQEAQKKYEQTQKFEQVIGVSLPNDPHAQLDMLSTIPGVETRINEQMAPHRLADDSTYKAYESELTKLENSQSNLTGDQRNVYAYLRAAATNPELDLVGVFAPNFENVAPNKVSDDTGVDKEQLEADSQINVPKQTFGTGSDNVTPVTESVIDANTTSTAALPQNPDGTTPNVIQQTFDNNRQNLLPDQEQIALKKAEMDNWNQKNQEWVEQPYKELGLFSLVGELVPHVGTQLAFGSEANKESLLPEINKLSADGDQVWDNVKSFISTDAENTRNALHNPDWSNLVPDNMFDSFKSVGGNEDGQNPEQWRENLKSTDKEMYQTINELESRGGRARFKYSTDHIADRLDQLPESSQITATKLYNDITKEGFDLGTINNQRYIDAFEKSNLFNK